MRTGRTAPSNYLHKQLDVTLTSCPYGQLLGKRRIAFLVPLSVGVVIIFCANMIHLLPVTAMVKLVRHEKRLGRIGTNIWIDMGNLMRIVLYACLAHFMEVALWAVLFIVCGEFRHFGTAFYHSAVNYTSLGYGDLIMTSSWRLLGPLETSNGMLLFGLTTAMVFTAIHRLVETRFVDLKR